MSQPQLCSCLQSLQATTWAGSAGCEDSWPKLYALTDGQDGQFVDTMSGKTASRHKSAAPAGNKIRPLHCIKELQTPSSRCYGAQAKQLLPHLLPWLTEQDTSQQRQFSDNATLSIITRQQGSINEASIRCRLEGASSTPSTTPTTTTDRPPQRFIRQGAISQPKGTPAKARPLQFQKGERCRRIT